MALGFFLGWKVSRHKRKHEHGWRIVGAQIGKSGLGLLVTGVLFRCECGSLKEETIYGHWTLEQLQSPTSDQEFLKSAGVSLERHD